MNNRKNIDPADRSDTGPGFMAPVREKSPGERLFDEHYEGQPHIRWWAISPEDKAKWEERAQLEKRGGR